MAWRLVLWRNRPSKDKGFDGTVQARGGEGIQDDRPPPLEEESSPAVGLRCRMLSQVDPKGGKKKKAKDLPRSIISRDVRSIDGLLLALSLGGPAAAAAWRFLMRLPTNPNMLSAVLSLEGVRRCGSGVGAGVGDDGGSGEPERGKPGGGAAKCTGLLGLLGPPGSHRMLYTLQIMEGVLEYVTSCSGSRVRRGGGGGGADGGSPGVSAGEMYHRELEVGACCFGLPLGLWRPEDVKNSHLGQNVLKIPAVMYCFVISQGSRLDPIVWWEWRHG